MYNENFQPEINKLIEIARSLSIPVYQMRLDELSEKYSLEENLLEN